MMPGCWLHLVNCVFLYENRIHIVYELPQVFHLDFHSAVLHPPEDIEPKIEVLLSLCHFGQSKHFMLPKLYTLSKLKPLAPIPNQYNRISLNSSRTSGLWKFKSG